MSPKSLVVSTIMMTVISAILTMCFPEPPPRPAREESTPSASARQGALEAYTQCVARGMAYMANDLSSPAGGRSARDVVEERCRQDDGSFPR